MHNLFIIQHQQENLPPINEIIFYWHVILISLKLLACKNCLDIAHVVVLFPVSRRNINLQRHIILGLWSYEAVLRGNEFKCFLL